MRNRSGDCMMAQMCAEYGIYQAVRGVARVYSVRGKSEQAKKNNEKHRCSKPAYCTLGIQQKYDPYLQGGNYKTGSKRAK